MMRHHLPALALLLLLAIAAWIVLLGGPYAWADGLTLLSKSDSLAPYCTSDQSIWLVIGICIGACVVIAAVIAFLMLGLVRADRAIAEDENNPWGAAL